MRSTVLHGLVALTAVRPRDSVRAVERDGSPVVIEEARAPLDEAWAAMTFPLYRPLLPLVGTGAAAAQGALPIACRALERDRPVGLVLAQHTAAALDSAELLSVYVAAAYRGRGIATRLVACLEHAARDRHGVGELTGSYMTGKPSTPAVERVFEKCGFTPPTLRMIVIKFTPEEAARTDWYRKARMPDGCTIFPWRELTAAEREELRRSQAATGWIHPDLEPWKCDERFDEVSSVGMRKEGRVVGWVINHRASPKLVTFTTSFMRKDLARRGAIFPLYVASIERLAGTGVVCSFVTSAKFDAMVRFALRRGAPFVHYTGETRGVSKQLKG
jgi:GNAT superfamily N-acetyltransferase